MAAADSVTFVGHNTNAAFLFESGSTQGDFPFKAMFAAVPKPKTWHVYKGGHETNPASQRYMQAWIQKNL
jgi:hypothetical protein